MLRKKQSRTIRIAEAEFRWKVVPQENHVIFVAEAAHGKGRKIEVFIASDINRLWVEFPYTEGLNLKVIYPRDAASIISEALITGWKPDEKGAPLKFELIHDKLHILS